MWGHEHCQPKELGYDSKQKSQTVMLRNRAQINGRPQRHKWIVWVIRPLISLSPVLRSVPFFHKAPQRWFGHHYLGKQTAVLLLILVSLTLKLKYFGGVWPSNITTATPAQGHNSVYESILFWKLCLYAFVLPPTISLASSGGANDSVCLWGSVLPPPAFSPPSAAERFITKGRNCYSFSS